LQEARRLCNKIKKKPLEIIATFLRKLWHHSMDSIRRGIGADLLKKTKGELDKAFVEEDPSAEIAYLSVNHWRCIWEDRCCRSTHRRP
jgi:hypothetical protein